MPRKTKFLDLFMESISKTISFGETYKTGLSFITFSYKGEKGYLGSIIPVFTKNKNASLKTLTTVSSKNVNWWYNAWNSIFKTAHESNKVDDLEKEFIHILSSLKNKEMIWIIPFSIKPQLVLFFKTLSKKLAPYYSSSVQTLSPLLGRINYAVFIRKGVSVDSLLKIIGEKPLKDFYLLKTKNEYSNSLSIIDDISKKLEEDKNAKDFLEGLAEYFSEENIENVILHLFSQHTPFSTFAKLEVSEQETAEHSHETVVAHSEPEDKPEEVKSEIKPEVKEPLLTPLETPEVKTKKEMFKTPVPEGHPSPKDYKQDVITDKLPLKDNLITVIKDRLYGQFTIPHKKIVENLVRKNASLGETIDYYTRTGFKPINRILAISYLIDFLPFPKKLDLLKTKIFSKEELKQLLNGPQKQALLFAVDKKMVKNVEINLEHIKELVSMFNSPESVLQQDITLFRGVPTATQGNLYNTEMWLRNPTIDSAKETDGHFQDKINREIALIQDDEKKIETVKKFYNMDKVSQIDPFFSTTLLHTMALNFNPGKGHLLTIYAKKGLKAVFINEVSAINFEEEVLLPPSSKFKLVDIHFRQNTDAHSLNFSLEYLGPEENLDKIYSEAETFWSNIEELKKD